MLSRNHVHFAIGVLVAPSKRRYTYGAILRARTSEYNILLTDVTDLYSDLVQLVDQAAARQLSLGSHTNPIYVIIGLILIVGDVTDISRLYILLYKVINIK